MLKISKMADYAVVVVISIDDLHKKNFKNVTSEEVSNQTGLSMSTVNQIIKALSRNNVVISKRGVGGGVILSGELGDISLLEVIQSVDGEVELTDCAKRKSECCSIVSICPVSENWRIVNNKIVDLLGQIKIKDMISNGCNG